MTYLILVLSGLSDARQAPCSQCLSSTGTVSRCAARVSRMLAITHEAVELALVLGIC